MVRTSQSDARQAAILAAAGRIIESEGVGKVSMKGISDIAGISRPAVYQYFASREHILAELVLNDMADLANELDALAAATTDPVEQLRAWVLHTLAYLVSPSHKIIKEISIEMLPADKRGLLRAMHGQFMLTLFSPLAELSPEDPHALSGFVYSAVSAAADRIAEGGDFGTEAATLERFLISGVVGS